MAAKKSSGSSTTQKSTKSEVQYADSKEADEDAPLIDDTNVAEQRGQRPDTPVHVDSTTARGDGDAREGQFAKVVSGKHQGRYGVFDTVAEYGDDGYPKTVILVTRDEHAEHIPVEYADLRPAEAGYRGSF